MSASDEAVRATNDDAASCKRSAVQIGYWTDPYIQFVTKASDRKPPEISRGYYARVKGVQGLVHQFLEMTKGDCQVVNLGAGSDTWYWNLVDDQKSPKRAWIEVDFGEVTAKKLYQIRSRKQLLEKIQASGKNATFSRTEIHSDVYHLVACDLRDTSQLSTKLDECGVDRRLPTVFIAECVLVYMSAEQSSALVKWIVDSFASIFFVNYEQVNMNDRFGKVMIANLEARGCGLAGVQHCQSLDSQKARGVDLVGLKHNPSDPIVLQCFDTVGLVIGRVAGMTYNMFGGTLNLIQLNSVCVTLGRFTDNGWQAAEATDMMTVYNSLPGADLQRIEKLEMLDDRDMLTQLCEHYCLCWAYNVQLAHRNSSSVQFDKISLIHIA